MKRKNENVVEVFGFGESWNFEADTSVEEVISFLAMKFTVPCDDMVIMDQTLSPPLILKKSSVLSSGCRYVAKRIHKPDTYPHRSFAVGSTVHPEHHFYVPPDVDELVSQLAAAKYCVLCGARQSGKSTMAIAAKKRLTCETDAVVVYLDSLKVRESWSTSQFWGYMWDVMHGKCNYFFPSRPPGEECTDWSFKSLFLKNKLPNKVILIVDEADSLLNASNVCLDEFFSTIKELKSGIDEYNLAGFLLVGVETVKDLLQDQYHMRRKNAEKMNRVYVGSRLSPFSHSFYVEPTRFAIHDIQQLLTQANSEQPGMPIEVVPISTSVFQMTGGHKGLVGSCLEYMMNQSLWSYNQWLQAVESELSTYIFGQQTYKRILTAFKKNAANEKFELLLSFLRVGSRKCDDEMMVELRDLIAEGILFAENVKVFDEYEVRISSPLLRSAILRHCHVTSETVASPPDPFEVNPEWVLLEAIRSLDGDTMCRPESLNASGGISEYSYQFNLFTRIKAVLKQAYPLIGAKVLPEGKQAVEYLEKRNTQERLDILVRDDGNFAKFGFQLVADDDVQGHMSRALRYHREHSAQVYVVNFTLQDEPQMVVPDHESIIFVSVQFNPSGDQTTANVTVVDTQGLVGARVKKLELKHWDGKIRFDHL